MKKHKHHDVIVAWAKDTSKIVQVRGYSRIKGDLWFDCEKPHWSSWQDYRIKPEPKPDLIVNTMMTFQHDWKTPEVFTSWNGLEIPAGQKHTKNLDYLEHIRFTFDGETNELKSVEIINETTK